MPIVHDKTAGPRHHAAFRPPPLPLLSHPTPYTQTTTHTLPKSAPNPQPHPIYLDHTLGRSGHSGPTSKWGSSCTRPQTPSAGTAGGCICWRTRCGTARRRHDSSAPSTPGCGRTRPPPPTSGTPRLWRGCCCIFLKPSSSGLKSRLGAQCGVLYTSTCRLY